MLSRCVSSTARSTQRSLQQFQGRLHCKIDLNIVSLRSLKSLLPLSQPPFRSLAVLCPTGCSLLNRYIQPMIDSLTLRHRPLTTYTQSMCQIRKSIKNSQSSALCCNSCLKNYNSLITAPTLPLSDEHEREEAAERGSTQAEGNKHKHREKQTQG